MTENIKEIFDHNIMLIGETDKAVCYFREQQYEKALGIVADFIDTMKYVIDEIITDRKYFNLVTTQSVLEMLSGILEAKKKKDFILLADLLEFQLISFLCGVQELIISKEEILFDEANYKENICLLLKKGGGFPENMTEPINTAALLEKGYRVEFTSCGLMTLAAENEDLSFYFHTNGRILQEAFLLARSWSGAGKKRYLIYGFGMGYHIRELQKLSPDAEIEVYESDRNVIQLACAFSDVRELINNEHIRLVYDPDLKILADRISSLTEEEAFFLHYPSFLNLRDQAGKENIKKTAPWTGTIELC